MNPDLKRIDDGGTAFPVLDNAGSGLSCREFGMTLRDYFAAKAMAALLGLPPRNHMAFDVKDTNVGMDSTLNAVKLSNYAYHVADAMLKVRKDGNS